MARKYFILAERCGGQWSVEAGDYARATIEDEYQDRRDHDVRARDLKIVSTTEDQAAIDAAVAKLNATASVTEAQPSDVRIHNLNGCV